MTFRDAMRRKFADFRGCRRAVIAIEFAIVLPVMLTLWLGVVEFGSLHLAAKKVEVAAQSVADLISQRNTIDVATLGDFTNAINAIMAPFPKGTGTVAYQIISVVADAADATSVAWYYPTGGAAPSVPPEAEPLVTGNDNVIVVTVSYSHEPWLSSYYVLTGNVALSETMYAKPRLVATIPCTDCP